MWLLTVHPQKLLLDATDELQPIRLRVYRPIRMWHSNFEIYDVPLSRVVSISIICERFDFGQSIGFGENQPIRKQHSNFENFDVLLIRAVLIGSLKIRSPTVNDLIINVL